MDPQILFAIAFPLALPFWALMILAPTWSVTRRIIASPLIVVPPLLVYAIAVLPGIGDVLPAVAAPTLAGVSALLATPLGAAAGWAHFVGFDLFVGRWIYLDARERGIHPLVSSPVLVLTILLGPTGCSPTSCSGRWSRPGSPRSSLRDRRSRGRPRRAPLHGMQLVGQCRRAEHPLHVRLAVARGRREHGREGLRHGRGGRRAVQHGDRPARPHPAGGEHPQVPAAPAGLDQPPQDRAAGRVHAELVAGDRGWLTCSSASPQRHRSPMRTSASVTPAHVMFSPKRNAARSAPSADQAG